MKWSQPETRKTQLSHDILDNLVNVRCGCRHLVLRFALHSPDTAQTYYTVLPIQILDERNSPKLAWNHEQFEKSHLTENRSISGTSALSRLITVKTNDEFASKVMASANPVIVNFHADWCEPCHILTPKMRELVENNENIDLAIIDVENHAQLVHDFEVQAVPAVLAVRNGLVVDKFVGLVDADMIEKLITKLENKID